MNDFRNALYAIDPDDGHITPLVDALVFAKRFDSRGHVVYVNDSEAGHRHPADREDAVALKVKQTAPEALLIDADVVYATSRGESWIF